MVQKPILILPGLDGTDKPLGEFLGLCPKDHSAKILTLPNDTSLDYLGLANHFSHEVQQHTRCHIVAESFSGPIGILLARKFPDRVSRLTLVASFAASPVPTTLSWLPWRLLFRLQLPSMVIKHFFVGQADSLPPLLRSVIKQSSTAVLHHRFNLVRTVDVRSELSELECPLTYIQATQDRLLHRKALEQILRAKPETTVHRIEGPHLIMQTHPDIAWQKITMTDQTSS